MRYLNLGCGSRFHLGWTNVDIACASPHVQAHDLRLGIPYPDDTFEVVYHSHLLEHLSKYEALSFTQECHRVLKPGGIVRVVVPDLERIARLYLMALERALQGQDEWRHHYEWMMLELYDQMVRERPGGEMLEYLKQDPIPNEAFVYERLGDEARQIVHALRSRAAQGGKQSRLVRDLVFRVRYLIRSLRARITKTLLGEQDYKALQVGRFRLQGEVHQWMYDQYSLARLLRQAGFRSPIQRTAVDSAIGNWDQYNLDSGPDGTVHKPDSLYMEAVKPTL